MDLPYPISFEGYERVSDTGLCPCRSVFLEKGCDDCVRLLIPHTLALMIFEFAQRVEKQEGLVKCRAAFGRETAEMAESIEKGSFGVATIRHLILSHRLPVEYAQPYDRYPLQPVLTRYRCPNRLGTRVTCTRVVGKPPPD